MKDRLKIMDNDREGVVILSIIVPHYNSPILLQRLLKTIPYRNDIEIIVIDDRSNLHLQEMDVCKKKFPYVRFFTNETEKKGAGISRNIGIKKSHGEWLMFADADDYFMPNAFECIVSETQNDAADIVYFNPTSSNQEGALGKRHIEFSNYLERYVENENNENLNALKYRFTPPWSKIIRRKLVIENDIFFDEGRCAEDVMFSCKTAYYARKVEAINCSVYCVTENDESMTVEVDDDKNLTFSIKMIERYKFLKERLSKKEMCDLDISSLGRMYLTLKSNMKIKVKVEQIKLLIKSGMPIIPRKLYSPSFWKVRFFNNDKKNQKIRSK
ncbi:MAG: glycosyltransferase [Lachnospiraceae bacterium]|nr:glycosyltransferase [Lachnospiraceae bacterium]